MITLIKNNIGKTVAIILTVFSIFGGVWALEDRYAPKEIVLASFERFQKQQEVFSEQQQILTEAQYIDARQQRMELLKSKYELYKLIKQQMEDDLSRINNSEKIRKLKENIETLQKKMDSVIMEME